MRKLLNALFVVLLLLAARPALPSPNFRGEAKSVGGCAKNGNVYDDLSCADYTLEQSKKDLNTIYQQIHSFTQHKDEFERSQKAWITYRGQQCIGYIAAEASQSQGAGNGLLIKDCFVTITRQRIDYLKTLLGK